VLVTGSNGFVGHRLVEMLVEKGFFVRGMDISPRTLGSKVHEFVQADLCDETAVRKVVEGMDTVFHVASLIDLQKSAMAQLHKVNVVGTQLLLKACCDAHVKRLIYTSSVDAIENVQNIEDGDESLPYSNSDLKMYGTTKAMAESMVLANNGAKNGTQHGLLTCAIRPSSIHGPNNFHTGFMIIMKGAMAGGLRLRIVRNDVYHSLTYIDNLCHAEILAAENLQNSTSVAAGKAYFINDGVNVKYWELLYDIAALAVPRSELGTMACPKFSHL